MTLVGVNEDGRRVGDSHHRAVLTDSEVHRVLDLHAEGIGYGRIASMMEVSKSQVRSIVKGRCRAQRAVKWKLIPAGEQNVDTAA